MPRGLDESTDCCRAASNPRELDRLISEAIDCLKQPSASQANQIQRLRTLADRLATSRLQVAILGQFKRGKSSLINALLGEPVLPTGIVPLTAIPTFLSAAPRPCLRLTYLNGHRTQQDLSDVSKLREALASLVTEKTNPANRLGLSRVEAMLPSPLLVEGTVLIDTPGVGSTYRHNTVTAEGILPECDAAIFVVSPDPPITEVELAYLSRIRRAATRLAIVLNKIDIVDSDDLETSMNFLRRVVTDEAGLSADVPILPVSARTGLHAKRAADSLALIASGILTLEHYLTNSLAGNKARILASAIATKACGLVAEMRLDVEVELRSLRMPLDDLAQRIDAFEEAILRFQEERQAAHDRINGDRSRMLAWLEQEAEAIAHAANTALSRELQAILPGNPELATARRILAECVPGTFNPALDELTARAQRELSRALGVHQRRADELIASVRRLAAALLDIDYHAPDSREAMELDRQPAWVTTGVTETLRQISLSMFERLLPTSIRQARIGRQLMSEVDAMVRRNVENLRWAIRQNIENAFRRFAGDLDERLAMSLSATHGAMVAARSRRGQRAQELEEDIAGKEVAAQTLGDTEQALLGISVQMEGTEQPGLCASSLP